MTADPPIVNKPMIRKELQAHYRYGRFAAWIFRRNWGIRLVQLLSMRPLVGTKVADCYSIERRIKLCSEAGGERETRIRIFRPNGCEDKVLPAMLYMHGGGYMYGVPEMECNFFFKDVLQSRDVTIIAPAYRLSLDNPYPAGFSDCYDTLLWMKENAKKLKVRADKSIVAGHSAGGGLTAAVSLKARDTKVVNIAFQMPVYPMMDHRMNTESPKMKGAPFWSSSTNRFAWKHYLKGLNPDEPVPPYASPSINEDVDGLPPAISFVGDMEPLKDETIEYMERLKNSGIPIKFKLFEGVYHSFEGVAPDAIVSKEANKFLISAFEEYFDRFLG